MARHKTAVWVYVWVYIWTCVSGVQLQSGGYEDLVLAIDPDMAMDEVNITELEQKITELMSDMSESMTKATNGRLSLRSVRVVLPHWWNNIDGFALKPASEDFSWETADIRLQQAPTNVFGDYDNHGPHTLQMGQCGVPGHHITIHTTFLDEHYAHTHYGPRGHVLMHEWAHYRWGVFEEYGHPMDPVYPVSYQRDGLTLPTACYEGELFGDFLTKSKQPCPGAHNDAENPCYFFPNSTSDPATTKSSLMSHTHLSEGSFCNEDTHDVWAPTPQNLMCGQHSVWEILETHPDFMDVGASRQQTNSKMVTISFQKSPMSRVFFLFEAPPDSESLKLKRMVRDFIQQNTELYGEIELGMATFRTKAPDTTEIINMLNFTSVSNFTSVEDYVPDTNPDPASDTLLGDALLNLLPSWERYQPGTLLVSIIWNPIVAKDAQDSLSVLVLDRRVKLLVLDSTGDLADVLQLMPLLQNTGGNFYVPDSSTDPMSRLTQDMADYLRYYNMINDHEMIGVSRQEVKPSSPTKLPVLNVEIHLEQQINGYLRITPFDPSSIEVTIANPYTLKPIYCNDLSSKLTLYCRNSTDGIFFYFRPLKVFVFEYSMNIDNSGSQSVLVETTWSVVKHNSSKPNVTVAVWSSEESELKAKVPQASNLFLYCQVSYPSGVVQNLQVTAEVEFVFEGSGSSKIIDLTDTGDRGVDVKARDTVWSGQLSGNWSAGTIFTVTTLAVNHNPDIYSPFHLSNTVRSREANAGGLAGGSANVLPIDPTEGDCCLSFSDENPTQRSLVVNQILLRPYSATMKTDIQEVPPLVLVVPQVDPNNPPFINNNTVEVILLLGGTEVLHRMTTTYRYLVRYHEDFATLRDNFTEAKEPLDGSEAPGDATSITVILPYTDDPDLYVAVATYYPSSGVVSPPSTATQVQLSSLTTTTTTTSTTTASTTTITTTSTSSTSPGNTDIITPPPIPTEGPSDNTDNTVTIIVVSVVCAVVVLGVAGGLFYYFKVYKRTTV